MVGQWREVLNRIVSLPYPTGAVLNMSDDAEAYFYNWYNGIIEEVNAIEDDAEVESRKMKLNGNAARLSLVFQVLKWATDGDSMQCVDLESVQAAIRMIGYYEETYRRIQELIVAMVVAAGRDLHGRRRDRRGKAGRAVEALGLLCAETVVQPAESPPGEDRPRDVSQTLSEQSGCTLHYCTFGRRNGRGRESKCKSAVCKRRKCARP